MGRNRVSDDADHIPTDPKDLNPSKAPPPAPWPIPDFEAREINNPLTHGQGNLPEDVRPDDPYAIFSLSRPRGRSWRKRSIVA